MRNIGMKCAHALPIAAAFAWSLGALSAAAVAQTTPTPAPQPTTPTPTPAPTVPAPTPQEIPTPMPAPTPPAVTPVTPAPIGRSNRPPPTRAPSPPDQQQGDPQTDPSNEEAGVVPGAGAGGAVQFPGCNAFSCADVDQDDALTEEEFAAFGDDTIPFDDIDRDHNYTISPEEWKDFRRKQARGGGR
jgi:hypothetical protein